MITRSRRFGPADSACALQYSQAAKDSCSRPLDPAATQIVIHVKRTPLYTAHRRAGGKMVELRWESRCRWAGSKNIGGASRAVYRRQSLGEIAVSGAARWSMPR